MKVFLVGYMGSGKSTIGKQIASELNLNFIDLDPYIEKKENRTVKHIFESEGEEAFRMVEKDALQDIIKNESNFVLATGGGTPCFHDNMKTMIKNGTTVYLNHDIKTLVNRLLHAKIFRPLIWGKSEQELTEYVEEMLKIRVPYYQQAHITIDTLDSDIKELADIIQKEFKKKKSFIRSISI